MLYTVDKASGVVVKCRAILMLESSNSVGSGTSGTRARSDDNTLENMRDTLCS